MTKYQKKTKVVTKSGSKSTTKKRRKRTSGGGGGASSGGHADSGGGGGGLLMSMRSGFRKAAQHATGTAERKPQSTMGKVLNYGLTIGLLALVVYLLLRRLGYVG